MEVYKSPTKEDIHKPTVVIRKRPKKYRQDVTSFALSSPLSSPLSKPEIMPRLVFGDNMNIIETPSPKVIDDDNDSPFVPFIPSYVPPPKKDKTNSKKKTVKWVDNDDNDIGSNTKDIDVITNNDNNKKSSSPMKRSVASSPAKRSSPKTEQSSSSSSSLATSKIAGSIIKDMDIYYKQMSIMGMLVILLALMVFSINDFGLAKLYRGSYMSTESTDDINTNTILKISILQPIQTVPTLSSNLSFELSGALFSDLAYNDQERVLTLHVHVDKKLIQFPGGNSLSVSNIQGPLNVAADLKDHGLNAGCRKITIHAIISNNDKGKRNSLRKNVEYTLNDYIPTKITAEAKESILMYYIDELMTPENDYSDPILDVLNLEIETVENENDIRILLPKNNTRIHEGDQLRVKLAPHYVRASNLKVTVLFDKREFDVTEFARKQLPATGKDLHTIFTVDLNGINKGDHLIEIFAKAIVNDEEMSCYDFTTVMK